MDENGLHSLHSFAFRGAQDVEGPKLTRVDVPGHEPH